MLRLKQIRRQHPTSVEATVRAWRMAWALPEEAMAMIRAHLPTDTPRAPLPVRSWLLTGLGRYPAATSLWSVVAGTGADMLATLASRCGAQPAPPRASGNNHTSLAHRSRARVARP